jgi:hypothetical protein
VATGPEVDALFDEVADRLLSEDRGLERARMFTSTGLRTGRRFFALVNAGDLVVKLPAPRVAELIEGGEGRAFHRGGGGPAMREWVRLQPADADTCARYMEEARAFVAGGGR